MSDDAEAANSEPESAPAVDANFRSASSILVEARERMNLSQKDVADKLFLTTTFIRYIDDGHFDRIPKPAFIRGYLRSYARVVEVSGDEIVALYEAELEAGDPTPEMKGVTEENVTSSAITGPVLQTGLIGLVALVIVVAGIWWFVSQEEAEPLTVTQSLPGPAQTQPQQDFDFVIGEVEVVTPESRSAELLFDDNESTGFITSAEPENSLDTPELLPEQATDQGEPEPEDSEPESSQVEESESIEDSVALSASEPPEIKFERVNEGERSYITVDAGGFDQLELTFTDECWVEVSDGVHERVYNDLNRSSDVLTLYGTAPFSVLLGKATAVEMIYNGRPFDLGPYIGQDETAKLTISN